MHRIALAAVALALVVLAPAAGAAAAPDPGILYSLDAKGSIVAHAGGSVRLSMPAGTTVTWFTDRPARRAGSVNLRQLAAIWDASGFTDDPPNAALLLADGGEERTHVVTMTAPQVANGRVSFAVRAVPNASEAGYSHTHALRAGRYGRARVFIDDAALNPCSKLGPPPLGAVPQPISVVQCLLAPGAGVTAATWNSSTGVFACHIGGSGNTAISTTAGGTVATGSVDGCGNNSDPFDDGDTFLGQMRNGACSTTTANSIYVKNLDASVTLRVSERAEMFGSCVTLSNN